MRDPTNSACLPTDETKERTNNLENLLLLLLLLLLLQTLRGGGSKAPRNAQLVNGAEFRRLFRSLNARIEFRLTVTRTYNARTGKHTSSVNRPWPGCRAKQGDAVLHDALSSIRSSINNTSLPMAGIAVAVAHGF
jgi:hypothetical protein